MRGDEERGSTQKAIIGFLFAVLAGAAANGVVTWSDVRALNSAVARLESDVGTIDTTLATIAAQAHANTIHRIEHERQAERWIDQIVDNERAIRTLQQTNPRPDPFTGTEGAALRNRIERLEQGTKGEP